MRHAMRRDDHEAAIVAALRAVGASVQRLDHAGVPDLLVGYRGRTFLLEVKHLTSTGKTSRVTSGGRRPDERGLTACQQEWWSTWMGTLPVVVRTAGEALAAIGVVSLRAGDTTTVERDGVSDYTVTIPPTAGGR